MVEVSGSHANSAEACPPEDPFVHSALFYRDDTEYLEGTVAFVTGGLASGEPVAVAVPQRQLKLLRTELGAAAEQVRFLDMAVVGRNPGRIIPGVLRAFADQYETGRVRIVGEPIWHGRTDTEYPACVQHEALINLAFTGRAATILCPYDTSALTPQIISDAAATHPILIDATGERASDEYAPEQIVATYNRTLPAPADSVTQDFDYDSLARLRPFARRQARLLGLFGSRIDDVVLTITELATNSVEHGPGAGTVRIWAADNHFVCQVSDSGQITNPLVGRIPARLDQIRGRGVLLVNHLADLVRMYTGADGTTFQVHFAR